MKVVIYIVGFVVVILVAGMIWARTAARPSHLGVQDGRLALLPNSPNGVATQSGNSDQMMQPIAYEGDTVTAQDRLMVVLNGMPRVKILANKSGYVWGVFRSAFFGFPDDVEFLFDDDEKVIHFRSASRLGYSDLGVNRKRMEFIGRQFNN